MVGRYPEARMGAGPALAPCDENSQRHPAHRDAVPRERHEAVAGDERDNRTQREQGAIDDLTSAAEIEDHRVLAVPKPNQGEPMMAYIDRIRPTLDDFLDPIIKEYVKLFGR